MTVSETTAHTKRTTVSFSSCLQTNAEYITPTDVGSSLAYFVDKAIDTVGVTDPAVLDLYTTRDHNTPNYVRNTDLWLSKYTQQLTCLSVWTEEGNDNQRLTTAITPRHTVSATHSGYAPDVGTDVRFVTADNQVVTRTVVQQQDIAGEDITICLLDTDLPDTITPAKVVPNQLFSRTTSLNHDNNYKKDHLERSITFDGYITVDGVDYPVPPLVDHEEVYNHFDYRVPVVFTRQTGVLNVADCIRGLRDTSTAATTFFFGVHNTYNNRETFSNQVPRGVDGKAILALGDSGNPVFFVAGDELWLAGCHWVADTAETPIDWDQPTQSYVFKTVRAAVRASNLAYHSDRVQQAIQACDAAEGVDTGYVVQQGNIAQFSRR
jgi:hypothetical protein